MTAAPDFSLYLVTDKTLAGGRAMTGIVQAAVAGGVRAVQLRDKTASSRELLRQARLLKTLLAPSGVPLIVNDRLDVALAAGAEGVHLGQGDLPCAAARQLAGRAFLLGVSVSTVEEAIQAEGDGANYLGISPVFDTPTKTDAPAAVGLGGLQRIRRAVRLPLIAIGGINAGNASQVIRAGADGLAVVSAIMSAPDPCAAARALVAEVARGRDLQGPVWKHLE
jgi:thiamine-phosphate pyrophosphorylase